MSKKIMTKIESEEIQDYLIYCGLRKTHYIRVVMIILSIICVFSIFSMYCLYFLRCLGFIEAFTSPIIIIGLFTISIFFLSMRHGNITKKIIAWCEENE